MPDRTDEGHGRRGKYPATTGYLPFAFDSGTGLYASRMLKKVILTFFNVASPAHVRTRFRQVRHLRA
jgi:hypothetical protein